MNTFLIILLGGIIVGLYLKSWKIVVFGIIVGLIFIVFNFFAYRYARNTAEWQLGVLGTRPYKKLAASNKKQNLFRLLLFGEVK